VKDHISFSTEILQEDSNRAGVACLKVGKSVSYSYVLNNIPHTQHVPSMHLVPSISF
jgi:hypothetical protein